MHNFNIALKIIQIYSCLAKPIKLSVIVKIDSELFISDINFNTAITIALLFFIYNKYSTFCGF